jgi:fibronectin type 3 domain-containing protein
VTDIARGETVERPSGLTAAKTEDGVLISWSPSADAVAYRIYCAEESEPRYTVIGDGITETEYAAAAPEYQVTYAVTAISKTGRESRRAHTIYLP